MRKTERKNNSIDLKKVNWPNLNYFRFKKFGKNYLLTNDIGDYIFLSPVGFKNFLYGNLNSSSTLYKNLLQKDFIYKKEKSEELAKRYQEKYAYLFQGPSLHIVVLTLRCDHKCIYCQASSRGKMAFETDMDEKAAKKIVETIFESPSPSLAIEFQGGEPLFNWPILKFIVRYSREKNKIEKKDLQLRLVSNFTLLDKEKIEFLFKHKVIFCTSLDGPEKLHNKNRVWSEGNSYKNTIKWLKYLLKRYKNHYIYQPGALTTISRFSFPHYKEIIDEYLKLGLDHIFLRPLSPLGIAKRAWDRIGYRPEEFLDFYKKSLDYIFDLNLKKKIKLRELTATYLAVKMLTNRDPNFLDLRSPCGAGMGQLLYNYNGDVYTCDEGRMTGNETFKIGNVFKNSYEELINNETTKTICLASCLDGLPCESDVYKPYLGVCPVINYAETGNIFIQIPNSNHYKIFRGIVDYLFEKIKKNVNIKEILESWSKRSVDFKNKNYED